MSTEFIERNPHGVTRAKPIALRLLPSERAWANHIANQSGMTNSALARKAFLIGIEHLETSLHTAASAEDLSGDGPTPGATSFSSSPCASPCVIPA